MRISDVASAAVAPIDARIRTASFAGTLTGAQHQRRSRVGVHDSNFDSARRIHTTTGARTGYAMLTTALGVTADAQRAKAVGSEGLSRRSAISPSRICAQRHRMPTDDIGPIPTKNPPYGADVTSAGHRGDEERTDAATVSVRHHHDRLAAGRSLVPREGQRRCRAGCLAIGRLEASGRSVRLLRHAFAIAVGT
jgi:hypothetical protein